MPQQTLPKKGTKEYKAFEDWRKSPAGVSAAKEYDAGQEGDKRGQTDKWDDRFSGRMMLGKTYRDTPGGGEEYLGQVLKQGSPLKTEILRGKGNRFTRRSLFGFETAAGDTTYHEFENTSQSMGILSSMEGLDMRSAMISGKPGVDISGAKSGDDYVANWGTKTASSVTKDVTGKIMGFLKGLRK